MNANEKYKIAIADYLDMKPEQVTLFWKGRVALYGLLKTLGVGKDDEVIVPGFTCVVVPNAIMYLGAKPVYADINPETYNIDIEQVERKITSRTKVLIAQNTFGLSCDVEALMDVAEKHNLVVIEDCTHGFGGFYKGRKNGTIADAAFFSSQWNKPFSTGIGGMAVVKDEVWSAKMNDFEKSCAKPSLKNIMMLRLLWLIRRYLLFPFFYWNAVKLFRWLSKRNIVTGSSEGIELSQPVMPEQYLKQLSGFQAKLGAKSIQRIDKNIRHRIQVANKYDEVLKRLHKTTPEVPEGIVHTFVKYPLLVKDRKSFIAAAEKSSIEIGDWFISPLHPIEEELSKWAFDEKQFPVATDKAKHIVNLPTHQDIDTKYLTRITEFLKAHQEEIL